MGCFHQTPPLKTQRSMQEKRQKDCNSKRLWMSLRKQYLPFITGQKHIWTQRNCDSLHRFVTDKIPVWREEIRHKIPSLTKKLFAIKYFLRKGKYIFYCRVSLDISTRIQSRSYAQTQLANTKWTPCFVLFMCVFMMCFDLLSLGIF